MSGGGSKPGERRGGRQKGTPNKLTADLKGMILGALAEAGGQAYLARQARENPGPFLALIGKVLPTTLAGDPDAPIKHEHTVEARKAVAKEIIAAAFGEGKE